MSRDHYNDKETKPYQYIKTLLKVSDHVFDKNPSTTLKDFVLFLKQKYGSTAQGSRLEDTSSKAQGMKKAFSEVSHMTSKVKEFFNFFQS